MWRSRPSPSASPPPTHKDGPTGNRYYSIDTFVKIRTIRIFQNLGLSLNEIRGYFDDSVDLPPAAPPGGRSSLRAGKARERSGPGASARENCVRGPAG